MARGHNAPRLTDADYDAVKRLHAEGKSRNDIAREIGRAQSTVSKIAAELGLSFVRGERVAAATAARQADARALRASIQLRFLEDAERLRQQLFEPAVMRSLGGKDRDEIIEHPIPRPSFQDQRAIAQAAGVLVDRAIKLDAYDRADESMSALDAWLIAMAGDGK